MLKSISVHNTLRSWKLAFPLAFILIFSLFSSQPAMAQISSFLNGLEVGVEIGTMGTGKKIGYRKGFIGFRSINWDYNVSVDVAEYATSSAIVYDDTSFIIDSKGSLLDLYPFNGIFRFTVGRVSGPITIEARGDDGEYIINGTTFALSDLTTSVQLDPARYYGIGWSNSLANSGLSFALDLGVTTIDNVNIDIGVNATVDGIPVLAGLAAAVANEEAEIQSDIKDSFNMHPIIQIGISYVF